MNLSLLDETGVTPTRLEGFISAPAAKNPHARAANPAVDGWATASAFDERGEYLAVGYATGDVDVFAFDMRPTCSTGARDSRRPPLRRWKAGSRCVLSVAWSADRRRLLVCCADSTVASWDLEQASIVPVHAALPLRVPALCAYYRPGCAIGPSAAQVNLCAMADGTAALVSLTEHAGALVRDAYAAKGGYGDAKAAVVRLGGDPKRGGASSAAAAAAAAEPQA
jgi:hypothetical protein